MTKLTDIFPDVTVKYTKKGLYPQKFTNKVVFKLEMIRRNHDFLLWRLKDTPKGIDKYSLCIGLLSEREYNGTYDISDAVHQSILLTLLTEACRTSTTFKNRVRHEGAKLSIAFDDVDEFYCMLNELSFDPRSKCVHEIWITRPEHVAVFKEGKEIKPSTTAHKYKVSLAGYIDSHLVGSIFNLFEDYNKNQIDSSAYFRRRLKEAVTLGHGAGAYGITIYISDTEMLTLLMLTGVKTRRIIELL